MNFSPNQSWFIYHIRQLAFGVRRNKRKCPVKKEKALTNEAARREKTNDLFSSITEEIFIAGERIAYVAD